MSNPHHSLGLILQLSQLFLNLSAPNIVQHVDYVAMDNFRAGISMGLYGQS